MKKGMKKILSVAIVLAMTMSLAACGGGTKETQGQASSETAAASGESAGQKPERPLLVKSRGAAH